MSRRRYVCACCHDATAETTLLVKVRRARLGVGEEAYVVDDDDDDNCKGEAGLGDDATHGVRAKLANL